MKIELARTIFYSLITQFIKKYNPKNICELGCGYGYNLSFLKDICQNVRGGEYSENAVELGRKLGFDLFLFNYYQPDDYNIIKEESLIFTCHSLEQIPDSTCFFQGLDKIKDNVKVVVHFEPTYLSTRTSLVGTLRNKYIEINDYNRNLIDLLQKRNDIDIIEFIPDYIGLNPLNSTNIIVWKFK